ncbi:MAG: PAS domain S-box protein, partial [Syntrophobacteraceae bacterium]
AVVAPIVARLLHGAVLFFLVMGAVFILAFVFSERISRPIRRLLEHTLALGGGDGKEPIAETGPAELKGLASAFNVMAEKIGAREKALVGAQKRLISVLEAIPASVYIQDRDCSIRFANRAFRETFGEPEGKLCYELLQGRSEPCVNCDSVRTVNTQTPQQWEWTDPAGRCYSIYSHPFTDNDGVPVVLKLVVDISERKRAWQAFLDSEKRYRELVQNANSAIIRMNKDGSITFFNEYAQSFFGYSEEEVLGKHVGLLLPDKESDGTDLTKLAENVLSRPEQYAYSVNENIRRDGSRVWMAWTNKPIVDESGAVVEVLSVGIDISDRKRAVDALRNEVLERKQIEAQLRLDEARLEALWRLSQMSESSADRIAEFALEQLVRLTGSQNGWIGLLDEAQRILTLHVWPKSLAGRQPYLKIPIGRTDIFGEAVREKRVVVANNFRDVVLRDFLESRIFVERILVVPVCEKGRVVAIAGVGNKAAGYEISDAREITLLMDGMWKILQREKAEKRLRDSESLAAMGRAMAAVAHDMKTPLIAIGGFSRLAQKRIGEDSPVQELLEIVVKETARMESMVKDMLDFSRPLELEFSRVDMVGL